MKKNIFHISGAIHSNNISENLYCLNIFKICIRVTGTWEHFDLNLRNKIFPKHKICARTQQIMQIFTTKQIS